MQLIKNHHFLQHLFSGLVHINWNICSFFRPWLYKNRFILQFYFHPSLFLPLTSSSSSPSSPFSSKLSLLSSWDEKSSRCEKLKTPHLVKLLTQSVRKALLKKQMSSQFCVIRMSPSSCFLHPAASLLSQAMEGLCVLPRSYGEV